MPKILAVLGLLLLQLGFAVDWPIGEWTKVGESPHVRYFELTSYHGTEKALPPEDIRSALARLEAFLARVGPQWDWPTDAKLDYYKFFSLEDMEKYGGQPALGKSVPRLRRVLSIFPSHTHEVAHILSIPPDRPVRMSSFWLEGLAESYAWPWANCVKPTECAYQASVGARNGHSLHFWAKQMMERRQLPSVPFYAVYSSRFFQLDIDEGYSAAGSFITFLLNNDPSKVRAFREFMVFWNTEARNEEDVLRAFERYFGLALPQAESNWKAFLETWDESSLR